MADRLQRTQILLEPEQHRALTELASAEGRSLSDVVRELIAEQLARRAQDCTAQRRRHLAGLETIRGHREAIRQRRGTEAVLPDPSSLIDQLREERDAELTAAADRR
jgi:hypothetical protein